jgi:hypothetical protein
MNRKSLLSQSAGITGRNKRYIIWFYFLNLLFSWWGAVGFSTKVHAVLDHSLYADKMFHGFDFTVFSEMMFRPEMGPPQNSTAPATIFAVLFFLASMIFMPGVLLGYSYDHRISRNEFFRACSQNLWRFVRLFLIFAVVAGIIGGILFGIQAGVLKATDQNENERLPVFIELGGLMIVFLVLTVIRIWFDLAQTDVVVRDQRAVRKSVAVGWRMTKRSLGRLLGTYLLISLVAMAVLIGGILLWHAIVPASSVLGAFLISQITLLLLLAMRFWQRATAVAFYARVGEETELHAEKPALVAAVS